MVFLYLNEPFYALPLFIASVIYSLGLFSSYKGNVVLSKFILITTITSIVSFFALQFGVNHGISVYFMIVISLTFLVSEPNIYILPIYTLVISLIAFFMCFFR